MDADRLTRWLSLGANIAVLAGILFRAASGEDLTPKELFQFRQRPS